MLVSENYVDIDYFFPLDLITVCLWQYLIRYVFTTNCLGTTIRLFLASLVIIVTLGIEGNAVIYLYCTTPVFLFIVKVEVNSVGGSLNLYRQRRRPHLNLCPFSARIKLKKIKYGRQMPV